MIEKSYPRIRGAFDFRHKRGGKGHIIRRRLKAEALAGVPHRADSYCVAETTEALVDAFKRKERDVEP